MSRQGVRRTRLTKVWRGVLLIAGYPRETRIIEIEAVNFQSFKLVEDIMDELRMI
jgi:hypothetical protein